MNRDQVVRLLNGWLTQIRQQNKAIRRKNKLIKRLRTESKLPDTGPWVASEDGRHVISEGFGLDVRLTINGDFYNDGHRKFYAGRLAARFNEGLVGAISWDDAKSDPIGDMHHLRIGLGKP